MGAADLTAPSSPLLHPALAATLDRRTRILRVLGVAFIVVAPIGHLLVPALAYALLVAGVILALAATGLARAISGPLLDRHLTAFPDPILGGAARDLARDLLAADTDRLTIRWTPGQTDVTVNGRSMANSMLPETLLWAGCHLFERAVTPAMPRVNSTPAIVGADRRSRILICHPDWFNLLEHRWPVFLLEMLLLALSMLALWSPVAPIALALAVAAFLVPLKHYRRPIGAIFAGARLYRYLMDYPASAAVDNVGRQLAEAVLRDRNQSASPSRQIDLRIADPTADGTPGIRIHGPGMCGEFPARVIPESLMWIGWFLAHNDGSLHDAQANPDHPSVAA